MSDQIPSAQPIVTETTVVGGGGGGGLDSALYP